MNVRFENSTSEIGYRQNFVKIRKLKLFDAKCLYLEIWRFGLKHFKNTMSHLKISTLERVYVQNFAKIIMWILFVPKCPNLDIFTQSSGKPMSDLKSAHSKQGTDKTLLKDYKVDTYWPKTPKFGNLGSRFGKQQKIVENPIFPQFWNCRSLRNLLGSFWLFPGRLCLLRVLVSTFSHICLGKEIERDCISLYSICSKEILHFNNFWISSFELSKMWISGEYLETN